MLFMKRFLAGTFLGALIIVTASCASTAMSEVEAAVRSEIQSPQLTPEYLDELVAPIALYPDALVAQVLAASTYPTEIVQAERWLQQHSGLKEAQLTGAVDKQSWDPSVKALTQFPSVLANMDKNLSWTSSLGDAYFNDPQGVVNAVQDLRNRAQTAGTLKTTAQQKVTTDGQTIIIEPANSEVVYLPAYDPWMVYGTPLTMFPGYIFAEPWIEGPTVYFDVGHPVVWGRPFHWGWHAWSFNWKDRFVVFNNQRFVSRRPAFINRFDGFHAGGGFGAYEHGFPAHEGYRPEPFDHRVDGGFVPPHVGPEDSPGMFHGSENGGSSFDGGMHGGFVGPAHGGGRGHR